MRCMVAWEESKPYAPSVYYIWVLSLLRRIKDSSHSNHRQLDPLRNCPRHPHTQRRKKGGNQGVLLHVSHQTAANHWFLPTTKHEGGAKRYANPLEQSHEGVSSEEARSKTVKKTAFIRYSHHTVAETQLNHAFLANASISFLISVISCNRVLNFGVSFGKRSYIFRVWDKT
jgi:hypothetical protein